MSTWTLQYGVTTQTLAAWGLSQDLVLNRFNAAPDVCVVSKPGPMDATPIFAYGEIVKIYRDGVIWFQGKAQNPERIGVGTAEAVRYKFVGPWWDLEQIVFQQSWKSFLAYTTPGDPTTPPTFENKYSSELFLGQDINLNPLTTAQQITEILTHAIACDANLQIGTIDAGLSIPTYNCRDISCAEAVQMMMRWTPDRIAWFDYTTTPPTIHIRKLSNLTNVTLTVGTDKIAEMRLTPRYDLQLSAVLLRFKQLNNYDGLIQQVIVEQKYPLVATGLEFGASVHTIELAGYRVVLSKASIKCTAIDAQSGVAGTRLDWWKEKLPWLKNGLAAGGFLTNASVDSATVVDADTGATVSLGTYPRELREGQIAPWMDKLAKRVKIQANVTYDKHDTSGHVFKLLGITSAPVSVTVVATNATTGDYENIDSFEAGEAVPSGLAQGIYDAMSTLQYEGEIPLADAEIPAGLAMGKKLTIAGTSLSLSNLLIQSTVEEPHSGRIRLVIGPAKQLGIADLIELHRVNRFRLVYNAPAQRAGTAEGGGANVTLGSTTPGHDVTVEQTPTEVDAVAKDAGGGVSMVIKKDATAAQFFVYYIVQSTGAVDTTKHRCMIDLGDLPAGAEAKFREVHYKDATTCVEYKFYVLCTEPVAV